MCVGCGKNPSVGEQCVQRFGQPLLGQVFRFEIRGKGHRGVQRSHTCHRGIEVGETTLLDARCQFGADATGQVVLMEDKNPSCLLNLIE